MKWLRTLQHSIRAWMIGAPTTTPNSYSATPRGRTLIDFMAEGLQESPLHEEQRVALIMAGVKRMFPVGTILKIHGDLYSDEDKTLKRVYRHSWDNLNGEGHPVLTCIPASKPDRLQEFCWVDPRWEEPSMVVVSKPTEE